MKYLIQSQETGKEYRKAKLPKRFNKIKNGLVYKVYEVKRSFGWIKDGRVYKQKTPR